jgi:hypothetical protein
LAARISAWRQRSSSVTTAVDGLGALDTAPPDARRVVARDDDTDTGVASGLDGVGHHPVILLPVDASSAITRVLGVRAYRKAIVRRGSV